MRQLAERYVCDRGRLVVECLSCGKRKEDAAEESNPAGYGSAFSCASGPGPAAPSALAAEATSHPPQEW